MKRGVLKWLLLMVLAASGVSSCGGVGGSEAGNPPAQRREVTGQISLPAPTVVKNQGPDCNVDEAVAKDSKGEEITASINSDCTFSLDLIINNAYRLEFELEGIFIARAIFQNSPDALGSPVMVVSQGETAIDLGLITCKEDECTPENEPSQQNDQDEDGENDFDDENDDGDELADEEEEDCDLDGYPDDYDEEESECDAEGGGDSTTTPTVLQVIPSNNATDVDLDEEVRARFSCAIDSSTVTATTFQVTDSSNNLIACEFELESSNRVDCEHETDEFLPNTIYTATLNGIRCSDGRTVETRSWSWTTEEG